MTPKVILTRGLPASGKSTWAKAQVLKGDGLVKRVNKDSLRTMLDVDQYTSENERFILKVRNKIITEAVRASRHIIVDDTNLNPMHVKDIRTLIGPRVKFEIQDFTDVDVEECIRRDKLRMENPNEVGVGEDVIRKMWSQWKKWRNVDPIVAFADPGQYFHDPALPLAIIVDIDGTLAHAHDRSHYDYSKVGNDILDHQIREVVARFATDHTILVMSGRESHCRPQTIDWLNEHKIPWTKLYMRPEGDHRDDRIIKRELFDAHVAGKFNVNFVLDDRDRVVDMWRTDLGLKCLQVAFGDF